MGKVRLIAFILLVTEVTGYAERGSIPQSWAPVMAPNLQMFKAPSFAPQAAAKARPATSDLLKDPRLVIPNIEDAQFGIDNSYRGLDDGFLNGKESPAANGGVSGACYGSGYYTNSSCRGGSTYNSDAGIETSYQVKDSYWNF